MDSSKLFSTRVECLKAEEPSLTYLQCVQTLMDNLNYQSIKSNGRPFISYNCLEDLIDPVLKSKLEREQGKLGNMRNDAIRKKRRLF